MAVDQLLRIGELSKRSGVSAELLRAWERRYGLLKPARSPGGLRLYSPQDLERVRVMREHLAAGFAAAEAAALASSAVSEEAPGEEILRPDALRASLTAALDRFDEPRAQTVLDRLLAVATLDTLLGDVVLPYLHELGERWERGEASVAQEHFASAIVRGRMLGLARDWGLGVGPVAVLACLPGEQHDIGLIAFGLALRARGWRIVYLGSDTPVRMLEEVAHRVEARVVVLSAVHAHAVTAVKAELSGLARRHRIAIGGNAARADSLGEASGLVLLTGDPIGEAERVAELSPAGA
ncbi:MAG: MerR family transcriptional regulator [Solirubrobacterales bacterium]|nr:MerR family transcriptional regulator [Solirubrobacterales bacterium]